MKKFAILLLIAVGFGSLKAHAQSRLINPNGLLLDTASQAAAEGPSAPVKGTCKTFNMIIVTTKISGTVAGTITWQCSDDGINYIPIPGSTAATLTDQAGAKAYGYAEVDKKFPYYKALITQTGTSSMSYSGLYYVTVPTIANPNN